MNKVALVGRLTRDPLELRRSSSNVAVIRFTIAVDNNRSKKDDNNSTSFINCVAFNKTAEFVELYFKKGLLVGIDGRLQSGSYEKDGNRVNTLEVICENVEILEPKGTRENRESYDSTTKEDTNNYDEDARPSRPSVGIEISDDSLPFI